jgi:hypothetical protein
MIFGGGQERTNAMRGVAQQFNWQFVEQVASPGAIDLSGFGYLNMRRASDEWKIENLLHAQIDGALGAVFDYSFSIKRGRDRHGVHTFSSNPTIFYLRSNKLNLPQFAIIAEGFVAKISAGLGLQDIDFAAYPQFSDKYIVQGRDPHTLQSVLHPALLDFFVQNRDKFLGSLVAEAMGDRLILYRENKEIDAGRIRELTDLGFTLARFLQSSTPATRTPPAMRQTPATPQPPPSEDWQAPPQKDPAVGDANTGRQSIATRLKELKELRMADLITEQDYQSRKNQILSEV